MFAALPAPPPRISLSLECMSSPAETLTAALFIGDDKRSQSVAGIRDELMHAATTTPTVVPNGTNPVNGVRWRRLASAALLSEMEVAELALWLEESYGAEMVVRFAEPLPDYSVPSFLSPVSAPDPAAGALGGMSAAGRGTGISGFEAHSATSEISRLLASMGPASAPKPLPVTSAADPVPATFAEDSAQQSNATGEQLAVLTFVLQTACMRSSPVYSSIPHCHFFLHAHARTPPELGLLRHGSLMAS